MTDKRTFDERVRDATLEGVFGSITRLAPVDFRAALVRAGLPELLLEVERLRTANAAQAQELAWRRAPKKPKPQRYHIEYIDVTHVELTPVEDE